MSNEVPSGCAVRAAAQTDTSSARLAAALNDLRNAVDFIDCIRADKKTDATATGASRDAREWLEEAARDVVAAMPPRSPEG